MEKIKELVKPFLSIIFGALIFLYHFDWLQLDGSFLALGIIAIILGAYLITVGILNTVLGDALAKKVKSLLEFIGVASYVLFMGVYFLLILIESSSILGPSGWTVGILSVAAGLGCGILLFISYFVKVNELNRIASLFGAIFALALLLDVLLPQGTPVLFGNIIVLQVVMYAIAVSLVFSTLGQLDEKDSEKVSEETAPIEKSKE